VILLYAFNATGKTRLSNLLSPTGNVVETEVGGVSVLCYNAFLEDIFMWDNENFILRFDKNSWFSQLVKDQGITNDIIDHYKDLIASRVEPSFDFEKGEVSFGIVSGDDESRSNIKISKSEESMLIWSVFFTILINAVDELKNEESDRTTAAFDDLKVIIVDDPVSSIDDTKIVTMAVKLIDMIKNCNFNFIITTHHALFFNVLVSSLKGGKGYAFNSYSLFHNNNRYELKDQNDAPFSYHLRVKAILEEAFNCNGIEKYHFNLFRGLLEKTSTFLGYNNWSDCIFSIENKDEFVRLLNLYSHNKLSELENKDISDHDKNLFKNAFQDFVNNFNWKK
jgi:wobble nucleotide-excising tRNase